MSKCRFKFLVAFFFSMCLTPSQEQTGCQDKNFFCRTWADRGLCTARQEFMIENCPQICGLCRTNNTTTVVVPGQTNNNPEFSCQNNHALCDTWANRGLCTKHLDYSLAYCPKICGLCQTKRNPVVTKRPTIAQPDFVCGQVNEVVFLSRKRRQLGGIFNAIASGIEGLRPFTGNTNPRPSRPSTPSRPATTSRPFRPATPVRPSTPINILPSFNPFGPGNNPIDPILNILQPGNNPFVPNTRPTLQVTTPLPAPTARPTAVGGGTDADLPTVPFVFIQHPTTVRPVTTFRPRPVTTFRPRPVTTFRPRPVTTVRPHPTPVRPVTTPNTPRPRPVPSPRPVTQFVNPLEKIPEVNPITPGGVRLKDAICGSAPITDRFLLSAAHCFPDTSQKFRVRIGDLDISQTGESNSRPQDVDIEKVYIHPDYRHDTAVRYNDIALLKTAQKIQFSSLLFPYCLLPRPRDFSGALLTVAGFGFVNGSHRSPVLQAAELRGLNAAQCEERYREEGNDIVLRRPYPDLLRDKGILCASAPGRSACQGDSGGPLTIKDSSGKSYLIGIVSIGVSCLGSTFSSLPGLYTEVAHYIRWIDQVIYGS